MRRAAFGVCGFLAAVHQSANDSAVGGEAKTPAVEYSFEKLNKRLSLHPSS